MIVRFGYAAMSSIVKNASPSKTMTAAQFVKIADKEAAVRKLERIAAENLRNTLRLLYHNRAHDIRLYRFSSRLIPLYGHEMLNGWDPIGALKDLFAEIGGYAAEHGMRVGFHPEHYTVLSTPREDVFQSSVKDLQRHVGMLEAMGLNESAKCNIHIGGSYGNKEKAMDRFLRQCRQLPKAVRDRLTLENDDKTFDAAETLSACKQLGLPMVLDIHHHKVNRGGKELCDLWPEIQQTWDGEGELPPKIHASSPKSDKDPRGHADYVNAQELLRFLREIAACTPRLDVMLEAKMKDQALFRLMDAWKAETGVEVLDQGSIAVS
ncbi:UV DNA damage repair endonuclease UvsE [Ferviditalea candida]|uniref:UV DNA damage repair endonuclease UvsE n=1 Tax=Ferviditalea candida TaxID=3108399 RepID=A0ABU5ZJ84_9BACL|nr:UV DNA damage repair endonuclease UvsE [Paenibacillaceae bacterium T2]